MRPVSETVKNLPRSHWHCTLNNFDWSDIGEKGKRKVEWFMDEVQEGNGPHLILTGSVGSGKTHLAVALYRWIILETRNAASAYYLNLPAFCDKVKRTFDNGGPERIWEAIGWASGAIVIDDLNGRRMTDWEREQVLYRLVDTVYRNNAGLVITDNLALDSWGERLSGHELSRLMQNMKAINFTGADRRMG